MNAETIFLIAIFALPLVGLLVYGIANRPRILSGPATVQTKNVEFGSSGGLWSSSWNYLVTFVFSDGEELQLYTTEAEYAALEEGRTGTLFWDQKQMVEFISD